MRLLVKIKTTELRTWLVWSAMFLAGVAVLCLIVFLIAGAFSR
jgi:hypothetical protein